MIVKKIEEALIAGEIGTAVFRQGKKIFILNYDDNNEEFSLPRELTRMDNIIIGKDSSIISLGVPVEATKKMVATTLEKLKNELKTEFKKHTGLTLLLIGIDPELELSTRRESIEALEELLREEDIYKLIKKDISLMSLVVKPKKHLIEIAMEMAKTKDCQRVKDLYEEALRQY